MDHFSIFRGALTFFATLSLVALTGCGDKPNPNKNGAPPLKVASFEVLITQHNCLACHLPSNQMGLPSWRDVSKKYQNRQDGSVALSNKITHGGSGSWSRMAMPPYPEIKEPEMSVIVQGILSFEATNPETKP